MHINNKAIMPITTKTFNIMAKTAKTTPKKTVAKTKKATATKKTPKTVKVETTKQEDLAEEVAKEIKEVKPTKTKVVKVKASKPKTKKKPPTAKETTAKIKELAAEKDEDKKSETKEPKVVKVKKETVARTSKYHYPDDIDDGMKRKRFRSTVRGAIRKFEKDLEALKEGTKEHKALAKEFEDYKTEVYS